MLKLNKFNVAEQITRHTLYRPTQPVTVGPVLVLFSQLVQEALHSLATNQLILPSQLSCQGQQMAAYARNK